MHANIFILNAHTKLYEFMLVNNYFANEDNDMKVSKTKQTLKKSIIPYNHNVYNIIPFVRDFFGGPVVTNLPSSVWDVEFNHQVEELRSHMPRGS